MRNHWLLALVLTSFIVISCSSKKSSPTDTKSQASSDGTTNSQTVTPEVIPPNPPGTQNIHGQATIMLRGQSWLQPLSKLQIVLMPREAQQIIKEIRDARWLETASRMNFGDGYNNLDLVSMGLEAKKQSILPQPISADAKGFYRIPAVKPGQYTLYAQYKSRYSVSYWLIPIEVKKGEDLKLDINNENTTEIHNRFKTE